MSTGSIRQSVLFRIALFILVLCGACTMLAATATAQSTTDPEQQGSVGIEGTISAPPPSQGATITLPTNGQVFTSLPVTVTGICPGDVLVKLYKNNVFAGSTQCENNSYTILIDLFTGRNELTARVFDSLDQEGPVSNLVTVTFNEPNVTAAARLQLISNYAKRGADPGQKLVWPIAISGGTEPYALSIDWGDGKPAELMSQATPGEFNISHVYDAAGLYKIIVKATDKNGAVAFLQLVGVANGPVTTALNTTRPDIKQQITLSGKTPKLLLFWPTFIMVPFIVSTFWLGRRHERHRTKVLIQTGQYFKNF